ncbi:MAG: TetR/AcrR family transcriptional regulator [Thermoleophilia bacterium]|nr:TetR/AcrR family transcriptional regulator [Thermoleophilia bacterium]
MAGENRSDVPQRVLEAAKQVFFECGYHRSSLRVIAKRAGTSESGVLRFYRGKLHLLQAVFASCWAQVNSRAEQALEAAAAQDPDPRHLLIALMRSVLEDYEADEPMMQFMLITFGFQETAGPSKADDSDSEADTTARQEYRRYLTRVNELCEAVVAQQPVFSQMGLSGAALAHVFMAMTNGVQGGWYGARREPGLDRPRLTIDEAVTAMRLLLYQGAVVGEWRRDRGAAPG